MANYESVEELFQAGTSNMEVLINNVSYDDNAYTAAGAEWLVFKGAVAANIIVSGNTWFGIGLSSEHLQINRRDTKMWYLYRETGLLYNYYRFLKFRWRGYSQYNTTSESNLLEYDVVFWDTGDISLHMVNIPTSNYNGTFSLNANTALPFTPPSLAHPDVTFYCEDEARGAFSFQQEQIAIYPPFETRWLVRADGKLYAISEDGIDELPISELTGQNFLDYGMPRKPDSDSLVAFTDPEVLCWAGYAEDGVPVETPEGLPDASVSQFSVQQEAVPFPQVLMSQDYDMTHSSIKGVETVRISASPDALFAISFDSGQTWYSHNGTIWAVVSEELSGMTAEAFSAISVDSWATIATTGKYRIRCVLLGADSYLESFIMDYLN